MNLLKYDEKVARSIQDQLNCTGVTENAVFPKEKENYRPRTLIDETLEYIDPTPNIYTLFIQFNQKFFWNVLLPVQVKWSPRMTSCAGICTFHPRSKECIISLSTPLLKLRPRKDLIETLLHEMIHAYLFLINDNRDRDGHGPVFKSHMRRINKEAGTNITVYHDFHEEVRLYKQHWWRCNGPCQKKAPFFGTVRRAMNRAPGPNDCWWAQHQATCGGQFIKIKEPEKAEPKNKKNNTMNKSKPSESFGKSNILNWVTKTDNNKNSQGKSTSKKTDLFKTSPNSIKNIGVKAPKNPNQLQGSSFNNIKNNSVASFQTDLKKLGNSTNNVHGWGTGGPSSSTNSNTSGNNKFNTFNNTSSTSSSSKNSRFSFSETLGGNSRGRSILLDKFDNSKFSNDKSQKNNSFVQSSPPNKPISTTKINSHIDFTTIMVNCPNCNKTIEESKVNDHLDICLLNTEEPEVIPSNLSKKRKSDINHSSPNKMLKNESSSNSNHVECPLCNKKVSPDIFNAHLDKCLGNNTNEEEDDVISAYNSTSSSIDLHDSPHHCLICDKPLEPGVSLNEHLEECVASVFNDSGDDNESFNQNSSVFNDSKKSHKSFNQSCTVLNDSKNSDESFNESSVESFFEFPKSTEFKKEILDKYPCPLCMTLVKEALMNEHLDSCLAKSEWNDNY